MIKTNLLEIYPNLLEVCRSNDCGFKDGIELIKESQKKGSLERFL